MKETQLVSAILQHTQLHPSDLEVWRNNTGAVKYKDERTGKSRFVRFSRKGSPDIIGIRKDGKFIAIECKVGSNKLTYDQALFKDMVLQKNGIYVLARDVEDWLGVL